MKANNCKLVISVLNGKVDIAAENVSQVDLAEICGVLQVFVGQEAIKRGMNIEDVKDNMLDLHLAAMETLKEGT